MNPANIGQTSRQEAFRQEMNREMQGTLTRAQWELVASLVQREAEQSKGGAWGGEGEASKALASLRNQFPDIIPGEYSAD